MNATATSLAAQQAETVTLARETVRDHLAALATARALDVLAAALRRELGTNAPRG